MTTREELLTALTGSVIDDGLYVAEVTPQQAEEIAELVWPFLEKVWQEGWEHYRENFSPNMPEYGKNPYK